MQAAIFKENEKGKIHENFVEIILSLPQ